MTRDMITGIRAVLNDRVCFSGVCFLSLSGMYLEHCSPDSVLNNFTVVFDGSRSSVNVYTICPSTG